MAEQRQENQWLLSFDRLRENLQQWEESAFLENKRIADRFRADLEVVITDDENGAVIRTKTTDVSDRGFSVNCPTNVGVHVGERVGVRIYAPQGNSLGKRRLIANGFAYVRRSELVLSEGDYRREIAFEFETPQMLGLGDTKTEYLIPKPQLRF